MKKRPLALIAALGLCLVSGLSAGQRIPNSNFWFFTLPTATTTPYGKVTSKDSWYYTVDGDKSVWDPCIYGIHWGDLAGTSPTLPRMLKDCGAVPVSWHQTVTCMEAGKTKKNYNSSISLWFDKYADTNNQARYEVMIWLEYNGVYPLSNQYSSTGAVPVKTGIVVAGITWDLYRYTSSTQDTCTFVARWPKQAVDNLSMRTMWEYLQNSGYLPNDDTLYIRSVQVAMESPNVSASNPRPKTTNKLSTTLLSVSGN